MSGGIEFDEPGGGFRRPGTSNQIPDFSGGQAPPGYTGPGMSNAPKMVQWLMKKGIVKSPQAAQAVLIAVVILNMIITFVVVRYFI